MLTDAAVCVFLLSFYTLVLLVNIHREYDSNCPIMLMDAAACVCGCVGVWVCKCRCVGVWVCAQTHTNTHHAVTHSFSHTHALSLTHTSPAS
jgi:hypothetical protein